MSPKNIYIYWKYTAQLLGSTIPSKDQWCSKYFGKVSQIQIQNTQAKSIQIDIQILGLKHSFYLNTEINDL